MNLRPAGPYALATVWLLAIAVWAQVVTPGWAPAVWFVAGMSVERVFHMVRIMWRADRKLREAEARRQAEHASCTCRAPSGPHEPDCVWWDRNCK
jgi:hypothetical protein